MRTLRPYVYLLGGAVALTLAGCHNTQPTPLPAPEPQAAPAVPVQHNLSADALFAFGKTQLKSADNTELDALIDKLKAASQIDSVHVLGYTDRIGGEQANQKLSAQRAEAVRDYLVAHGVPAGVIQAEGRGAGDPVAECPDQKREQLIACLAPNRRVVINTTVSDARRAAPPTAPVATAPAPHGVTRTVWIGPHTVPCDADNSGRCYRVRESENGPWKQWHGRIQGFNYVGGYDYELVVKAYRSDVKLEEESRDPASHSRYVFSNASGPSVVWVLDHVVSQKLHLGH